MLAIQARSFTSYFYLSSNNANHPPRFTANKVTGILFENKVDYKSTFVSPMLHIHLQSFTFHLRKTTFLIPSYTPHIIILTNILPAYFGSLPSFIHGIHILPINPSTPYTRPRPFVKEEWEAFFSPSSFLNNQIAPNTLPTTTSPNIASPMFPTIANNHPSSPPTNTDTRITSVTGAWRGILYANLAQIDAKASYAFFRDGVDGYWDEAWIDGGASRTWYLVWAAAWVEFARRREGSGF